MSAGWISTAILVPVLVYLLSGLIFAVLFVFRFVNGFDPQAKGASLLFRILILPGCILLWPLLLIKMIKKQS